MSIPAAALPGHNCASAHPESLHLNTRRGGLFPYSGPMGTAIRVAPVLTLAMVIIRALPLPATICAKIDFSRF